MSDTSEYVSPQLVDQAPATSVRAYSDVLLGIPARWVGEMAVDPGAVHLIPARPWFQITHRVGVPARWMGEMAVDPSACHFIPALLWSRPTPRVGIPARWVGEMAVDPGASHFIPALPGAKDGGFFRAIHRCERMQSTTARVADDSRSNRRTAVSHWLRGKAIDSSDQRKGTPQLLCNQRPNRQSTQRIQYAQLLSSGSLLLPRCATAAEEYGDRWGSVSRLSAVALRSLQQHDCAGRRMHTVTAAAAGATYAINPYICFHVALERTLTGTVRCQYQRRQRSSYLHNIISILM